MEKIERPEWVDFGPSDFGRWKAMTDVWARYPSEADTGHAFYDCTEDRRAGLAKRRTAFEPPS